MTSTTGQLPAVVTILDLGSATLPLDSTVVFEAVQSSNGTMISVQVPLTAIMTTVQGALPTGGGTGQILNKTNANNYSTQWSSITQFVAIGTGLATSGSATSIVIGINPPVSVPNGGTNFSSYVTGDILYASNATTLARLAGNTSATTQILSQTGNGVVAGAPAWTTPASVNANVAVWLATPTSANLRAAVTEGGTGTGAIVCANTPTFGGSITVPIVFGVASASVGIKLVATAVVIGTTTLSPDSVLYVSSNGTTTLAPTAGTLLHIVGANASLAPVVMDAFGSQNLLVARRASGTSGTLGTTASGDVIFSQLAQGYNGTSYATGANIQYRATENWNGTSFGSAIALRAMAAGTTTIADSVVVGAGLMIGTTTDPGFGNAVATGKLTLLSGSALSSTATAVLLFGSIASFGIYIGTGVPAANAGTGSLFLRNDGNTNTTRMYVNINGTGTWTAVNTVA